MILADERLQVSDAAFAYLRCQRGRIADLAHDRKAWEDAYNRDLTETYHQIAPFLPRRCDALLDIGSGLGGIDVLISRHYRPDPQVWLLDGTDDVVPGPSSDRHDVTFNSMRVARAFLAQNCVRLHAHLSPFAARDTIKPLAFDLMVSFQAWGFHLAPSLYLDFVKRNLAPDGVLIIDLRRGRLEWLGDLLAAFRIIDVAARAGKYERLVLAHR